MSHYNLRSREINQQNTSSPFESVKELIERSRKTNEKLRNTFYSGLNRSNISTLTAPNDGSYIRAEKLSPSKENESSNNLPSLNTEAQKLQLSESDLTDTSIDFDSSERYVPSSNPQVAFYQEKEPFPENETRQEANILKLQSSLNDTQSNDSFERRLVSNPIASQGAKDQTVPTHRRFELLEPEYSSYEIPIRAQYKKTTRYQAKDNISTDDENSSLIKQNWSKKQSEDNYSDKTNQEKVNLNNKDNFNYSRRVIPTAPKLEDSDHSQGSISSSCRFKSSTLGKNMFSSNNTSHNIVKLPSFGGREFESLSAFLAKFEKFCLINRIPISQKCDVITFYLEANALIYYNQLSDSVKSNCSELVKALETRFKKQDIDYSLIAIKQSQTESCNDYLTRALKISTDLNIPENILLSLIIQGLNLEIRKQILLLQPKNMSDLARLCKISESNQASTLSTLETKYQNLIEEIKEQKLK